MKELIPWNRDCGSRENKNRKRHEWDINRRLEQGAGIYINCSRRFSISVAFNHIPCENIVFNLELNLRGHSTVGPRGWGQVYPRTPSMFTLVGANSLDLPIPGNQNSKIWKQNHHIYGDIGNVQHQYFERIYSDILYRLKAAKKFPVQRRYGPKNIIEDK